MEELKQTNHRTRKPIGDVNKLYVLKREGRRGLASIQDSDDASIQWLEDYIKKYKKTDYSDQKQYRQQEQQ